MAQVQLTGLTILSTEFERAKELNIDELIDEFATKKMQNVVHNASLTISEIISDPRSCSRYE